jgi:hypothetical protein
MEEVMSRPTLTACFAVAFVGLGGLAMGQDRSGDPLGDVVQDMKAATKWLAKSSTDVLTQETQKDAVEKLDAIIAELEKQIEQGRAGRANANPTRPMQDSMIKAGPGGMGKLHGTKDEGKHWADLPPHERERILQSMTDGFPAHYQGVLEAYFKRIAEEKPLGADGQGTAANRKEATRAPGNSGDKPSAEPKKSTFTEKPSADSK